MWREANPYQNNALPEVTINERVALAAEITEAASVRFGWIY
jgi:hypothetical protein